MPRVESVVDPISSDTKMIGPLCDGHGRTLICENDVRTRIIKLNFRSRPSAIQLHLLRAAVFTLSTIVTLFISDPIKGAPWRTDAQILEKVIECASPAPSIADFQTTSAITIVVRRLRVVATLLHLGPGSVCRTCYRAVSMALSISHHACPTSFARQLTCSNRDELASPTRAIAPLPEPYRVSNFSSDDDTTAFPHANMRNLNSTACQTFRI